MAFSLLLLRCRSNCFEDTCWALSTIERGQEKKLHPRATNSMINSVRAATLIINNYFIFTTYRYIYKITRPNGLLKYHRMSFPTLRTRIRQLLLCLFLLDLILPGCILRAFHNASYGKPNSPCWLYLPTSLESVYLHH